MRWVIGIDIGGTNLVTGAVAEDGSRVVGAQSQPTDVERGADAVIARLVSMVGETRARLEREDAEGEVLGAGVGVPGPLDIRKGIVLLTPNLGWTNLPLRARLAEGLGLPTTIDNDANAAVLGECWVGAGQDAGQVIGLTIGTGIGGGIVIDGELYHGASDAAGEFGHTTIDVNGPKCSCGNHGCLEAFASGRNIARRAVEQLARGGTSRLLEMAGGDLDRITAHMVFDAAGHGDELAGHVTRDTARYLGIGIANFVNIFNPDVVIVMGGVTHAGDLLFVPLRREVERRAFKPAVEACRVIPGALDGLAGVYGAARAFLDQQRRAT
jgi:glucokinase